MTNLHLKLPFTSQQPAVTFPQNWKTDGRGKSLGFKRTQFRKGAEWKGNKGGRPRALTDAYVKWLAEKDEKTGVTGAEKIAKKMIEVAQSDSKNNVAAAREVTRITEG